jgi:manganese transport protein
MSEAGTLNNWSNRTSLAAVEALAGRRTGLRAFLPFFGPAVIASVAYMDPGNFATNIQAGSRHGYQLLWVVISANVVAMLFQSLSAKLGITTGRSLAQQCRDHLPKPLVIAMWIASEIAAMATDLAEFLGGAIGLSLLFGLPLFPSLIVTGVVTYGILLLQGAGFRPLEIVIGALVLAIGACYLVEMILVPLDWPALIHGSTVPKLADGTALMLAVGIIGATVMPHAIYLHSGLVQSRVPMQDDRSRRAALRFSNREVIIALGLAGLVNMAMIAMAAAVFHQSGRTDVAEIETAYQILTPLFGGAAAMIFMISLLASGFSSSVVGTMAGQMIMQDFLHIRIPLWLRRVVTMSPAFVVVALGIGTTQALVASQVILSLVLPVPMIALIWFTSRRKVMGDFVNSRVVTLLATVAAALVLSLNALLLLDAMGIPLPWSS